MGWLSSLVVLVAVFTASDVVTGSDASNNSVAKSDLTGVVSADDGKPVTGATVYIYTAGVRTGYSPYCPSCYADCGKRTTTDAEGRFEIKGLDPELVFRVLTVADDYEPKFAKKVDPAKGELAITLSPRRELPSIPKRWLKGRVIDGDGKPIVGAMVEPMGRKTAHGRMWGELPMVDPMAISNASGEFVLTSREDIEALDLQIHARGMVTRNFELVEMGKPAADYPLYIGSFVKGRLVKDGKPLPGVEMGLVQKDRRVPNFVGPYTIATDDEGRFMFSNVVPNEMMAVYAKMDSLKSLGSAATGCLTGPNGKTTEVRDLEVRNAYTISGKVILSDGKPIPKGIKFIVSRDRAWDSQVLDLAEDGKFHVDGIPPEVISVDVTIPGYRLSRKNVSLDAINGFGIKGVVNHDIDNLTILLEPGEFDRDDSKLTEEEDQKRIKDFMKLETQPLQGMVGEP